MLTTFSGRRASQDEGELTAFVQFLRDRGVTSYLEVGAREGDTFHYVVSNVPAIDRAVALDLPGGLWGKATTASQLCQAVCDLQERGEVEYIIGASCDPKNLQYAKDLGPFDAILIDGDHTYEGVKADWEAYRNLAPIIAFHDIVGEGQFERVTRRGVEVPKLWAEIKASGANVVEFVSPGSAMGIGVVII